MDATTLNSPTMFSVFLYVYLTYDSISSITCLNQITPNGSKRVLMELNPQPKGRATPTFQAISKRGSVNDMHFSSPYVWSSSKWKTCTPSLCTEWMCISTWGVHYETSPLVSFRQNSEKWWQDMKIGPLLQLPWNVWYNSYHMNKWMENIIEISCLFECRISQNLQDRFYWKVDVIRETRRSL